MGFIKLTRRRRKPPAGVCSRENAGLNVLGPRGEAVRIELASLAAPEACVWLTARGYRLHGFENVLGRSLAEDEPEPSPGDITTAPASRSQANVTRQRFALLYARAILIRGWDESSASLQG